MQHSRGGVIPTPPWLPPSLPFEVIPLSHLGTHGWSKSPAALLEQLRMTGQAEMRQWDNFSKIWEVQYYNSDADILEVMEP